MPLFVSERDNGIDPGRAAGRNKTGEGGNDCEQAGHRKVNEWIERVYFEQDVLQRGRDQNAQKKCGASRAENQADRQLPRALFHHHSENSGGVSTQRHSNAKLLGALIDRKTHYTVETDGGENEGNDSENREEGGHDAIRSEDLAVKLAWSSTEIGR